MNIDINVIKNSANLNIARKYDQYDDVEDINIVQKNNHYVVEAIVTVFSHQQKCSFELDENHQLINYHCDCPFCDELSPCGHIGAVILKLNSLDINEYPFHYVSSKKEQLLKLEQNRLIEKRKQELQALAKTSNELISINRNQYQTNLNLTIRNEKYDLTPTAYIDDDNDICIEYRIGNNKKYIIKNLPEFIARMDNQENYSYGKFLELVHSEKNFSDFALKQIDFIRKCVNYYNEKNNESYYSYYYYRGVGREIYLEAPLLDDFYDLYKELLSFEEIENKIEIFIENELDYYVLKTNTNGEYICGEKHLYQYGMKNNDLMMKRMTFDDDGQAMKLILAFIENDNNLVILKDNYLDFYKYVLLPVSQYFIIHDRSEKQVQTYDEIKIYGDIDDDQIIYFQPVYVDENQNRVYGFQNAIMTNYQQDLVESYMKQYASYVDYKKHKAYFDVNSQKTYEFMFEGLEFLKDYADIFVSEGLKRIGKKTSYHLQVGVRISNDLLAFDVNSHEIPKNELKDVLSQYRQKKKFYRLKNGELLYLDSPDLEELSEFMDEYHIEPKDIDDGSFSMSKQRMLAIDDEKDDFEFVELEREKSFTDTIEKFKAMDQKTYPIQDHYKNILRDYQKEGYVWLHTLKDYGFNGILADDMGLGKTLQVITLLESLETHQPSLVVCPSSLIYNWEDEVHKFSQVLNVTCITGNQDARRDIIDHIEQGLYVTSYDYMRRDYELYQDIEFEYVILDEAQYIKNQKTQNARSVKSLNAKHKLALTGTPIENSLAELWSIFDFLMPQYLFNYHYFQNQYETDIVKRKDENKAAQLKRLVGPFILRRNKKDVLTELPDKIEQNMILPFNDEEEKLYMANLAKVNEELQQMYDIEGSDKMQILKMLTRLRQLCLEPRIIYENIDKPSSKLKACMELLKMFKENKQKVLLFSSFTKALDFIADECKKAGISYYMLTGDTKKEKRRELVANFQKDDTSVFLISLKAGGTGLNLTAAEAVIHYDPWWNVSAQNQATDRAYRIGQKNNVQVFNLVMKDSVEEKILQLQKEKKELADMFVENNSGALSQMSKDDILELFKM